MTDTHNTEVDQIDFGAIAGRKEPPKGAFDTKLAVAATGKDFQTLSFRSILNPDQLVTVRNIAKERYPEMLADRSQLAEFGSESLDGVNACVERMLAQQRDIKIPEVNLITREMNDAVRGFQRKWDPKSVEVAEKFAGIGRFMSGLFGQGKTLLEDLYFDSKTVEERLDKIAAKLVERKRQLDANVALCDQLYLQNEAAIKQLVGVIAILEQIREESLAHAEALRQEAEGLPAGSQQRRDKEEELRNVTEFLDDINIQTNEFIQRLYVAWTTSPQIRNIRKISYGLSQRLRLLVKQTIPVLKQTVAVWGSLLQAEEAGKVVSAINDANNDALQQLSAAAADAVPRIAGIVQAPSTTPETIMAVAASIIAQNEGIEKAAQQGELQRAAVVDAIVTASRSINESGAQLNDTLITLVNKANQPLELPAAPEVPKEVLQLQ